MPAAEPPINTVRRGTRTGAGAWVAGASCRTERIPRSIAAISGAFLRPCQRLTSIT
jgi:hypothetical protein